MPARCAARLGAACCLLPAPARSLLPFRDSAHWHALPVARCRAHCQPFCVRLDLPQNAQKTRCSFFLCAPSMAPASTQVRLYLHVLNAQPALSATCTSPHAQYTKYACVSGKLSAGSAAHTTPSASTVYLSGSTFIFGLVALNFISLFPIFLQFFTASTRLRNPYDWITPDEMEA